MAHATTIEDEAATDWSWDRTHRALVPLLRADNHTNIVYLLGEYVGLLGSLAAGVIVYRAWASGGLSNVAFAALAALVVFAVAVFQHRLSGLAHEGSHYALFRNRLANELASDLLCMFPLMSMTQRFRVTHLGHHQFLNDPERDPDVARLHFDGDRYPFPMPRARFWYRYVVLSAWLPTLVKYLFGQAKNANVTTGLKELKAPYRFKVGRCLRGTYWLPILALVHITGSWPIFFLFWVLPLLTVYPFLMQLREIAHHSNAPAEGEFTHSRNFHCNPLFNFCVFPYGQDYHLTHHVFGLMPHYNLAEAHRILERYPPYREQAVSCHGYFFRRFGKTGPTVLEVLAERRGSDGPIPARG
ncbi:fatty acid desaturase family protein [Paludisphaera soli]|uniref:fatty acid desaturase family protein n=1 Tax=Paludisphaera soli TaxID=2712865 RepID=UPI0013EABD83|nr:fatty acid desaturase [Paludisphaera soli]